MKNYELINELLKYPAYCEISAEVEREYKATGEITALVEGVVSSELVFLEDFEEHEIVLYLTGANKGSWKYANEKAVKQTVKFDNDGVIVRETASSYQEGKEADEKA